ncbi:DUF6881 domain-containing protein [Nocardia nova]|uniref:DUF6881 domain-containing protein n=1 Tax=Nocardia nova TaxID=37330 RepID=UPI0011DC7E93|nr:hypothetical protein [Nocardia nova]
MKYLKVKWNHQHPEEPVYFYSELSPERYEVRKIQIYGDGHRDWASETSEHGSAFLAEIQFPSLKEISSDADVQAWDISAEEFEALWKETVNSNEPGSGG